MNWPLLLNSLVVAGCTAAFACIVGVLAALFACGLSVRGQKLSVAAAIVALAVPPFLATNCWLDLLGVNSELRRWIDFNVFSIGGTIGILTLLIWPIPFLLARNAWTRVDATQLEVDPLLRGATLMRWLLWPLAKNSVWLAFAIVFVLALNNFAVPAILQVKVFPAEVWVAFNTNLNVAHAFLIGWPMLVAPALLLLLLKDRGIEWPHELGAPTARAFRRQIGGFTTTLGGLAMNALVALSVVLPIAQLLRAERSWTEFVPAMIAGTNALGNSVAYAGSTAVFAVLLALLLWRFRIASLFWLLFFTPGVLFGVALAYGLNQPGLNWFYGTAAVVVFAFVLRYVAVAWSAARGAMQTVDAALIDAARLEGASGFRLFTAAYWPQVSRQVAGAAYIIYLLALWDVETLVLIVPPGGETLALRIFNLLHYGHNTQVNALCLLLLGLALAPLVLWSFAGLFPRRRARDVASVAVLLVGGAVAGCSARHGGGGDRLQSSIFSHVEIIGSRGTGPGQFNKPRSLALDTNDNLFVVDMTGRVQKFSPDGTFLLSWQMPETDLGKPKGMDRDRAGNIVVIEPHYQRVNHFTPEGKLVAQWGHRGTNAGELTLPRAVAVDTKGNIIISEYTLVDRVQKFSDAQRVLACWGTPGLKPGMFNRAEGVGVDSVDRIYVADSCNHRVQVFDQTGAFLRAYGQAGRALGELSYPYDIRIDAQGRQFICEFGNSRVQVFDANDRPLEIIGRAGGAPGEFSNPWSLALDSKGNLYVADSQNHRVQKLVRRKAISHQTPVITWHTLAAVMTDYCPLITDYSRRLGVTASRSR